MFLHVPSIHLDCHTCTDSTGTEVLDQRIEGFVLNLLMQTLTDMADEEFNNLMEQLAVSKLEPLSSLG